MQAVFKGIGRSVDIETLRNRFDGVGPRLLANLFVAVLVLVTVVFFIERDVKNRQSAKEGEDIRSFLEMTIGMLDAMNAQVERGEIPLADAQAAAIVILEEMRFRGDGYFFVFDDAMTIISHGGNGSLAGVSAADMKDPEGAFVYRELLKVSRAGTGTVEYLWTKPGSEGAWPKLGAAVPFAEWGWHIGTGVYTDNLVKQIAAMRMGALMIVVPGVIVLLLIATLISLSITRPIKALSSRMNALSEGDAATEVPGVGRGGEIGEMARSIDAFRTVYTEASQAETREAERRASEMQSQKRVVEELGSKLHAMSEGDLSQRIVVEFEGEYDRLRVDFNNAVDRLRSAIGSVVVNSSNIFESSKEVSKAGESLARRTEKQAATLEETAAAIEQLTEGVKSTADGAERANSFVEQTQSQAEEGGRTLAETVAAMEKIRSSSEQISQIIGVIDDIAFQTNLLALNAGVEAARAGDAGRSFSVVAGEVQALAQRSANAAKEIKELINMGSQNVETGVDVVARTGAALSEIERSVGDVSGLVAEITEATKDQSNRIEEINTAVLQLDQVTQQNAAMVEESSAASTQLEQEAQGLSDLTNQFVIGGDAPPRPRGEKTEAARPRTMGATALKVEPDKAQDDWEDF